MPESVPQKMHAGTNDAGALRAPPRVLLVLDSSAAWSRGVLRGFVNLANERAWEVLHYQPAANLERLAAAFAPSAVVCGPMLTGPWPAALSECVRVAINVDRCAEGIASVCLDHERTAELAASHLLTRGFRNLTTFRLERWGEGRERCFREAAIAGGAHIEPGWSPPVEALSCKGEDPLAIMAWLSQLRKPCGIFSGCDAWSRIVARYARAARLRVPEDLALIGVDNDSFECEVAVPPLSSVAVPWRGFGEAAARLVQLGLAGEPIAGARIPIAPVDVVARRSTDALRIEDALVAGAVAWIHRHVGGRLTVPMIADATGASRQRLERHFRRHLGRTVMEEVRRARVEVARRLLSTTKLPLSDIAQRSGFSTQALLNVAFRRELGIPPGRYRRQSPDLAFADE